MFQIFFLFAAFSEDPPERNNAELMQLAIDKMKFHVAVELRRLDKIELQMNRLSDSKRKLGVLTSNFSSNACASSETVELCFRRIKLEKMNLVALLKKQEEDLRKEINNRKDSETEPMRMDRPKDAPREVAQPLINAESLGVFGTIVREFTRQDIIDHYAKRPSAPTPEMFLAYKEVKLSDGTTVIQLDSSCPPPDGTDPCRDEKSYKKALKQYESEKANWNAIYEDLKNRELARFDLKEKNKKGSGEKERIEDMKGYRPTLASAQAFEEERQALIQSIAAQMKKDGYKAPAKYKKVKEVRVSTGNSTDRYENDDADPLADFERPDPLEDPSIAADKEAMWTLKYWSTRNIDKKLAEALKNARLYWMGGQDRQNGTIK